MKIKLQHLLFASLISLSFMFLSASDAFSGTQFSVKGNDYTTYNTTSASGIEPKVGVEPKVENKDKFRLPDYMILIHTEKNYGGYDIPYNPQSPQEVLGTFRRFGNNATYTVFFKIFYGGTETNWFLITDLQDNPISEFTSNDYAGPDYPVYFKVKANAPLYSAYHAELVMCVWDGSKASTQVFKLSCSHTAQ